MMTESDQMLEPLTDQLSATNGLESEVSPSRAEPARVVPSQVGGDEPFDSGSGGAGAPTYVYALGRVEARFPTLAVEKEFAQVTKQAATAGLTDRQAVQSVLSERANRYLARQLCWVFTIEGLDTYILAPSDPADLDLLIDSLRPAPRSTDVDVVIGILGPIAPSDACNGLMLPIVVFDQLYSFDVDALVKSIPRPDKMKAEQFEPAAEELFARIMQIADNAGSTDEDRALNYLAVRDPSVYASAAKAFTANSSLTAVDVRPSRLSATRKIADVIFTYTNRQTGVDDRSFTRVDVTEEFPFLVTKLSPFFEH